MNTLKSTFGALAATAIVAGTAGLMGGFYEGRALGQKEGENQATKNLVTAVQTIGKASREKLEYHLDEIRKQTGKKLINYETADGYEFGKIYLLGLEDTINTNADSIAKGQVKIEDTKEYKILTDRTREGFHF